MNPFDISSYTPSYSPLTTVGYERAISNVPLIPPLAQIKAPVLPKPDYLGIPDPPKDIKQSLGNLNIAPSRKAEYYYTQDLDKRYNDPSLPYDPNMNMEDLYSNKQGEWGALGVQLHRAKNGLIDTLESIYQGKGRTYENMIKLEGWDNIKNSYLNLDFSKNAFLDQILDSEEHPIYSSKDPGYFSFRGGIGDLIGSSGFTLAGTVSAIIDTGIGIGYQALNKSGLGNAVLGTIATGALALTTDEGKKIVGEDNVNLIFGIMAGGAESFAIGTMWDKISKAPNAIKQAQTLTQTIKNIKNNRQVLRETAKFFDDKVKSLTADTLLDSTTTLGKNIVRANTINKLGKTLTAFGKSYVMNGAEAGLEALQAQSEFIQSKLQEPGTKDFTFYETLKKDAISLGENVYDLNRVLLAITSYAQFGDILTQTSIKNLAKDAGIELVDNKFIPTKTYGRALRSNLLIDSVSEGIEEVGQLAISKGTIDYYKQDIKDRSKIKALIAGSKEIFTKEGLESFIGGMLMGSVITGLTSTYKGTKEKLKGNDFMTGFTGVDKKYQESLIKHLEKTAVNLNKFFKASSEIQGIKPEDVSAQIFEQVASSVKLGTFDANVDLLNNIFSAKPNSEEHDVLMKIYGSQTKIDQAKEEISSKINLAKKSIDHFQQYYSNPFTLDIIQNLTFSKEEKTNNAKRAEIFDNLVEIAARSLFINQEAIDVKAKFEDTIRPFLSNEDYDYTSYFTSDTSGFHLLQDQIKIDIDALKEVNIPEAKEKLARLEKLKETFDKKIKGEEETDTSEGKKKIKDLADFNPVYELIKDAKFLTPTGQNKQTLVEGTLRKIQEASKAIRLTTIDLETMTDQKYQKQYIEGLLEIEKTFETKQTQRIETDPENISQLPSFVECA